MCRFKPGDILIPIEAHRGFEELRVEKVVENKYHCSLMHGMAIIPVKTADVQYERKE